jgi:glutamine synthetase
VHVEVVVTRRVNEDVKMLRVVCVDFDEALRGVCVVVRQIDQAGMLSAAVRTHVDQ